MTKVIVVRHGETEWNMAGRQQGHMDSPLTELGLKQAEAVGAFLTDAGIDVVYSSDLGRASTTANIIDSCVKSGVTLDGRLRERNLGTTQGLTLGEFSERYSAEYDKFFAGDPDYIIPEGESIRQRFDRSTSCIEELAVACAGKKILLVTHGGVLDGMFRKAVGLPLNTARTFSLFNAGINEFTIAEGSWNLDSWGLTQHLGGLETRDYFSTAEKRPI